MIKDNGDEAITNATGANLLPGIVSCFIDNFSFRKTINNKFAVIEVDEANLKLVTQYISPEIIIITNLFRDQLDRFGEVYTTLNKILEGIYNIPLSTLVLNGDESLLGDLPLENRKIYYGFSTNINDIQKVDLNADAKFCKNCKEPYEYNHITYNHLGDYYCLNCGYKRPELDYSINKIINLSPDGSLVLIDDKEFYINQSGSYNIYNALSAYSAAKLLNIEDSIIMNSLEKQKSSFGRQENINIGKKEVKILLVKNPAGCDEAINTIFLDKREISLAVLLNDNYADGRDVSWIFDVNFEKLSNLTLDKVLVSGTRLYDMAIRLKISGIKSDKLLLSEDYSLLLNSIKNTTSDTVYIMATYTAMINFRKFLHSKGFIKNLW